MKLSLTTILLVAGLNGFSQDLQDSLPRPDKMPNGLDAAPLLKDTLGIGPKMEYYRLPGGMICIKPDASYRAPMPNGFRGYMRQRKE